MAQPPLSRDQLYDYFVSFDFFDLPFKRRDGEIYAKEHVDRIWKTLEYIPRLEGKVRVLELGADPYLMSFLVMRNLGYEITPANFFGDYGEAGCGEYEVGIRSEKYGDEHTFRCQTFNLEREPFPYGDGEFQICLCCEILEHLVSDPSHMLREIHRVLEPGGHVVITTPNAARFDVLRNLFWGRSPHYPYSGTNLYERHNREYAAKELRDLLKAHHFEATVVIDDVHPHGPWYGLAARLGMMGERRDNLFAVGRKRGVTIESRPSWLYEWPMGRSRVEGPRIVMGSDDREQLGTGWHDLEYWPPEVRWSSREATAHLLPRGEESSLKIRVQRRPRAVSGRVLVNGTLAGNFSLEAETPRDLLLPLPDEARARCARGEIPWYDVTIHVDDPLVPSRDLGDSEDDRELGIPVELIELCE
jgi:SAM-dependent methyltransferase